jgi:hypothetical protein
VLCGRTDADASRKKNAKTGFFQQLFRFKNVGEWFAIQEA